MINGKLLCKFLCRKVAKEYKVEFIDDTIIIKVYFLNVFLKAHMILIMGSH